MVALCRTMIGLLSLWWGAVCAMQGQFMEQCLQRESPPFHRVVRAGKYDTAVKGILSGFSVREQSRRGYTPLHEAAFARDAEPNAVCGIINTLCALGGAECDVRAERNDALPLHCAATSGLPAAVSLLIKLWLAGIEARDRYGRTPLHCAVGSGHPASVAALLRSGAEINARDGKKRVPIHYLAHNDEPELVLAAVLLCSPVVDFGAVSKHDRTPLEEAQYQLKLVAWLGESSSLVQNIQCVVTALANPDEFMQKFKADEEKFVQFETLIADLCQKNQ